MLRTCIASASVALLALALTAAPHTPAAAQQAASAKAPAQGVTCPAPAQPPAEVAALAEAVGAQVVHGRSFAYVSGVWDNHGAPNRDFVIGFTNSAQPELADVVTHTGIYSIQLEAEHRLEQPQELMAVRSVIYGHRLGFFALVDAQYPKGLVVLFDDASEQVRAAVAKHLPEARRLTGRDGMVGVAWHSAGRFDVPLHRVAKGDFRVLMRAL